MNFYSNENNVENHFDNINGSSFNYNSFIGDENSSDDYPQQFTFNKYRSEFLSPFPYIDYSTAPQSNLLEDLFFPKKGEENNLDDFNDIQKDSNENKVICEINKDSLENRKQPLGRPPLNNNSYIGKHSNKAADNGSKKIIRCCIKSIFECFQKEIKLYSKSKKIRIRKLHIPTIKNYLNKGNSEKYSLFNSSMKTIFIEMIPRIVKKEIRGERYKYSHNRNILSKILKIEEDDKDLKIKKLNIKFNAEFKIYLKAFLNDEKYIIINGEVFNFIGEFKTLKDYYTEGKTAYNQEEKEKFKEYIFNIMDRTIQFRKKRKIVNNSK